MWVVEGQVWTELAGCAGPAEGDARRARQRGSEQGDESYDGDGEIGCCKAERGV